MYQFRQKQNQKVTVSTKKTYQYRKQCNHIEKKNYQYRKKNHNKKVITQRQNKHCCCCSDLQESFHKILKK